MMSKRLVLIAVTALSMMYSGIAEARVCWLGDTSPDCTSVNYGPGVGSCSNDYKSCSHPRAGAPYCVKDGVALYKEEDCCSTLGYEECTGNKSRGYGESCLDAVDNVRLWQYCGCAYGFVDQSAIEGYIQGEEEETGVSYEERCGTHQIGSDTECLLSICNTDRRWFNVKGGEWCQYRLPTRCGGFGCEQLFNCDNTKDYYRNEEYNLIGSVINFIGLDVNDPLSNEKKENLDRDEPDQYGRVGNKASPHSSLISKGLDGLPAYGDYELTNKIVCAYKDNNGNELHIGEGEGGTGLSCNGLENYCYLFDTTRICNNDRGWYHSSINAGKIYGNGGNTNYFKWMSDVEVNGGYDYNGYYPLHKAINESFEYNSTNKGLRDAFLGTTPDWTSTAETDIGCIYVTHTCHPGQGNGRECYKRIACNREKSFYHSFINAASAPLYNVAVNTSFYYWQEYENLNKEVGADGLYLVNLDDDQIDRYVYPACVYEINACNDSPNGGLEGGGCYRYTGCDEGFDTAQGFYTEHNISIEEAWAPWFRDVRPVCNNLARCYKATACDLDVGAYSSEPNTSFFITGSSTGSGTITCYRGFDCRYEAGAYSSAPNTSFFFVIDSAASGSTCYRGESCHIKAGAYSSTPNTSFFFTIKSESSGSISYRADKVREAAGAYSSTPNTSFFLVAESMASGSRAYRAEREHREVGAYTSAPNTSFFMTIKSEASGSVAYRADREHRETGAYSSTPNTSFFMTIQSLASGSTAYRAEREHREVGAYSSTPNTSFFFVIKSVASGSTAYRAEKEHAAAGAYSSEPNTSFFITINSLASGSTAYRAEDGNWKAGAYSSTPNTSFFFVIKSMASGSTAYRAESGHWKAGAYSSEPNTSFFITLKSMASGSTCYRGIQCREIEGGAYTTSPNTEFFDVTFSKASGSECYRGANCGTTQGSYSSSPNTSFFVVIDSAASGSTCYRSNGCYSEAGAYSSTPNTSFFNAINSLATGLTCYRGENCGEKAGAYSSIPNTVFFKYIESTASGSTCYRGEDCEKTANGNPNSSFFVFVNSKASGSTCYRSSACNIPVGAYSSVPNTSFFVFAVSTNAELDSTCYRGTECHIAAGAYSSEPNTSFFMTINSLASGSTSYRAYDVRKEAGAYSSTPNTSFFFVLRSLASGSTSYRAESAHKAAGAYSSAPNTSFFNYITSKATGSTAYRANEVHIAAGAYSSEPNTRFFNTIVSYASGSASYRAESRNDASGAYPTAPNTSFFNVGASHASGSQSYRGDSANIPAGAYSSTPNTSFFFVIYSLASGNTSYRAESAHIAAGAYSSTPNLTFFNTIISYASGSTSYRADKVNIGAGSYSSTPNTSFFITIRSLASGSASYRAKEAHIAAGAYTSEPNTVFFDVIHSKATGKICYRGRECAPTANANPNEDFFVFVNSKASGSTCYRSSACNYSEGAYSSVPNTSFFNFISAQNALSDSICYRTDGCRIPAGAYNDEPNTMFFITIDSTSTGLTCYRGSDCNKAVGGTTETDKNKLLNTSFFVQTVSKASGSSCYRGDSCAIKAGAYSVSPNEEYFFHTVNSVSPGSINTGCYRADKCALDKGAYSSTPNTSFFITISSKASGSICYRFSSCRLKAGAYSSTPNTSFFITIHSEASGSENRCYRGTKCHTAAGAYSSTPNAQFFKVTSSKASGSICYRVDGGCSDNAKSSADEINTSFFYLTASDASGVICYRGDTCNFAAGAYTSASNPDYFHTISSNSPTNNTKCYRADRCNESAGAYSSVPNTSFFMTASEKQSASICYRGTSCSTKAGAYSSEPNTLFFVNMNSEASGITCYRGVDCAIEFGGVRSTDKAILLNTSFFITISSKASGSICYRGNSCRTKAGTYSVKPSTSYFYVINSVSPGSVNTTCYRAQRCHFEAGAYTPSPNTSFFYVGKVTRSKSTCYRGTACNVKAGAYKNEPNVIFFDTIASKASGSTCYRGKQCSTTYKSVATVPNTSYFATSYSKASGLTCYRTENCHTRAGAYSSTPNTEFFMTSSMVHEQKSVANDTQKYTCYRGTSCIADKSYKESEKPDANYFTTISSKASGSTCYRANGCNIAAGAYTPSPNTSFFITSSKKSTGSTCYRGESCNIAAGAYSAKPNTDFFKTISSEASSKICYRVEGCADGTVTESNIAKVNTSFFVMTGSEAGGVICYRGDLCHIKAGSYSSKPDTNYFHTISSTSTRPTTCYRSDRCHFEVGSYASTPDTRFFKVAQKESSKSTCYRATACNDFASPTVNWNTFLITVEGKNSSSSTCYRGDNCNTANRAYSSHPNECIFKVDSASRTIESGTFYCYRVSACVATTSNPNTCFFTTSNMTSEGGTTCPYATGLTKAEYASAPNQYVWVSTRITTAVTNEIDDEGLCKEYTAYYATGCRTDNYWYTSSSDALPPAEEPGSCYFGPGIGHQSKRCENLGGSDISCFTRRVAGGLEQVYSGTTPSTGQPFIDYVFEYSSLTTPTLTKENAAYVFSTTTVTQMKGSTSSTTATALNVAYPIGCNNTYCWYKDEDTNTSFFKYTSYTVIEAGDWCKSSITCNKATSATCTSRNTNVFTYTSSTTCGATTTPVFDKKNNITSYQTTGCNESKHWYASTQTVNTSYFKTPETSSSATEACGGQTCYTSSCDPAKYSYTSLPNTSYFKWKNGATASGYGYTCKKCECKYDPNSGGCTDPSYFEITQDNKTPNLCASSPAYCLNNRVIEAPDRCHLTFAERCNQSGSGKEVIVYENGTTSEVTHDSGQDGLTAIGRRCKTDEYTTNATYKHAQYFLWGSPLQCAETIRRKPTGCNEERYSYGTEGSGYNIIEGQLSNQPASYGDIFVEGFYGACNNVGCFNSCSCNEAMGWFASRARAASAGNGTVVGVKSVRKYAQYHDSTTDMYANVSNFDGDEGHQTCYHATDNNDCYFVVSDVTDRDMAGSKKVKFTVRRYENGVETYPEAIYEQDPVFGMDYEILRPGFTFAVWGESQPLSGNSTPAGGTSVSPCVGCPPMIVGNTSEGGGAIQFGSGNWYTPAIYIDGRGQPQYISRYSSIGTCQQNEEEPYQCHLWPANTSNSYYYLFEGGSEDGAIIASTTATPHEFISEYYGPSSGKVIEPEDNMELVLLENNTGCDVYIEQSGGGIDPCPDPDYFIDSSVPTVDCMQVTEQMEALDGSGRICFKVKCIAGYRETTYDDITKCAKCRIKDDEGKTYACKQNSKDYEIYFGVSVDNGVSPGNENILVGKCPKPNNGKYPSNLIVHNVVFDDGYGNNTIGAHDKEMICNAQPQTLASTSNTGAVPNYVLNEDSVSIVAPGSFSIGGPGDDDPEIGYVSVGEEFGWINGTTKYCYRLLANGMGGTTCDEFHIDFYAKPINSFNGTTAGSAFYAKCNSSIYQKIKLESINYRKAIMLSSAPDYTIEGSNTIECDGNYHYFASTEFSSQIVVSSMSNAVISVYYNGRWDDHTYTDGSRIMRGTNGECTDVSMAYKVKRCPDGYFDSQPELSAEESSHFTVTWESVPSPVTGDMEHCYKVGCKGGHTSNNPGSKSFYDTYTYVPPEVGTGSMKTCYYIFGSVADTITVSMAIIRQTGDVTYDIDSPSYYLDGTTTAFTGLGNGRVTITEMQDTGGGFVPINNSTITFNVSKITFTTNQIGWIVGPALHCRKDQYTCFGAAPSISPENIDKVDKCEIQNNYGDVPTYIKYSWTDRGTNEIHEILKTYKHSDTGLPVGNTGVLKCAIVGRI